MSALCITACLLQAVTMKSLLLICLAFLACVTAYEVEILSEQQRQQLVSDEGPSALAESSEELAWHKLDSAKTESPEQLGLILNSQAKKVVKNFLHQMPCGWPEYGIPPLAPYTNANLEVELTKSVVDSLLQLIRFRLDGLDQMEIKKLKVSYTFNKKVKYHFNFKELKATASTFNTNTVIDLLQELGLSVRYEGSGPMEFVLENLSIQGQFKYKMPFIFGSIKIYNFEAVVSLGGVRSNIGGILGNGRFNEFINDEIEYRLPAFINGQQAQISAKIEQNFVPRVNAKLKGKKIWSLLGQLGSSNKKCDPAPAPWLIEY